MEQNDLEGEFRLDQEQTASSSDPGDEKNQRAVVKSSQAPDFVPWEEQPLGTPKKVAVTRHVIIKKEIVTQGAPLTIVPDIPQVIESESMTFTPVKEGETIVGMAVTCTCGRSQEVRFEFD